MATNPPRSPQRPVYGLIHTFVSYMPETLNAQLSSSPYEVKNDVVDFGLQVCSGHWAGRQIVCCEILNPLPITVLPARSTVAHDRGTFIRYHFTVLLV